jgi:valyl-tRNA synthetase
VEEGKSIMFSEWPEVGNSSFNADVIKGVDGKFEMVRSGRYLRSNYSIADGKKLDFHIKAADEKSLELLKGELDSLKHLLNASNIELGLEAFDSASRGAAPSQLCALGVISLPLAGLIDVEAECAKLEKQLKDIDKWLAGVRGRLANEKFVKSAPEQVVADARKNLEELEAKRQQTEAILAGLR